MTSLKSNNKLLVNEINTNRFNEEINTLKDTN
jgi:hypothetical protein